MMDSSNSPQNSSPKILLIAGLNNNDTAMETLALELEKKGFTCALVNLPGQGDDRSETENLERAQAVFSRKLLELTKEPYSVIAFSTGAVYYSLWLSHNRDRKPLAQVFLSPAFIMRSESFLKKLFFFLPNNFAIKSFAPREFRRYHWMKIAEYQLLFALGLQFKKSQITFEAPTRIIIDARDELVSAKETQKHWFELTTVLKRKSGKIRPGMFHAIFHPDFWTEDEWKIFVDGLSSFLVGN